MLDPTPEEMRAFGYAVVDAIVDHVSTLPEKPVTRTAGREETDAVFSEPLPRTGRPAGEVLRQVCDEVFPRAMYPPHPRFFGYIPGPGSFLGAMGDALVSGFNVWAASWLEAAGPTAIELTTADWLREIVGLPETGGGVFTGGGATANLTALLLARDERGTSNPDDSVVYASTGSHCTNQRATKILGFDDSQRHAIEVDADGRMRVDAFEAALRSDRDAGRRPLMVTASAGTTGIGAVDDLPAIAALCREHGVWMHVDAAFAGAVCFSKRHRHLLAGIELADSVTIDPHKWLWQPFGIGCLLVRDETALDRVFAITDDYLAELETGEREVNLFERGIEMTRPFRALKLWMTIQVLGADAIGDEIDRQIELAEHARDLLTQREHWRIVTPPSMGIVSFRFEPPGVSGVAGEALQRRIIDDLIADGHALITTADVQGRTAMRMCTINPRTRKTHIQSTIDRLDELARRVEVAVEGT